MGGEAADGYLRGMADLFDRLAENPHLGVAENELGEGVRSHPFRKHRAYYRVTDTALVILRVFHHAQLVRSERLDDR